MAINSYKHVDADSSGGGDGSSWDTSGGSAAYTLSEMSTFITGTATAGDVIFVKDATASYTFGASIAASAVNGSVTSPIVMIGVKAATTNTGSDVAYSDWATDAADRPFFDTAAYQLYVGSYWVIRNIDWQGANISAPLRGSGNNVIENCKFDQDIGSSQAYFCLQLTNYNLVVNCELLSTYGRGLIMSIGSKVMYCYFHDFTNASQGQALDTGSVANMVLFNVFDECTQGVNIASDDNGLLVNNTFYECDTGVNATDANGWMFVNNIMEGNDTYGFRFTTQTDINFFWKNHGDDTRCTDMWSNVDTTTVFQDYEVSTGDPKFATAGSDFSLESDSPNVDNGMSINLGVG